MKEQEKTLTGYPSIDKPWLKYYKKGADVAANNIPENKTVWDVIEEKLWVHSNVPAIEYFNKKTSRKQFIEMVYTWAKVFRTIGIEPDEVVSIYSPFFPDICAMVLALNMIGACAYFLKIAITQEALEEETKEHRIAIVYDEMWENVSGVFSKDRFEKVLIATAADSMPSYQKRIVSFLSKIKRKNANQKIPNAKKYIRLDQAKHLSNEYKGNVKVSFKSGRAAFITSSSGTTVGGIVKGTVATNESTISQLYMADASDIQYFCGERCLNHFPPTASTSLNVLFLLPLYKGLTVLIDPRVSEKDFYRQITRLKPNIALTTGSSWEAFFNRISDEIKAGKKFDFSCAKGWTIGGEGTDVRKFQKWNEIMRKCNATNLLFSGYGSSELFSAVSVEKVDVRYDCSKQIMSVGIPYAGIIMGVFDKEGKELPYNRRGELWVKSKSAMKEYYRKPELTAETKVNGWIHTGDLAEIDENGFVYIWGRINDVLLLSEDDAIYLFDIANKIKEKEYIDDAIVLAIPTEEKENNLMAHIVWRENVPESEKSGYLEELNDELLNDYLPTGVSISAYFEHKGFLPYSPTTLKKDKNKLSNWHL